MHISIVVGGQYGSEGNGKVTAFFAEKSNAVAVIRCGGTNSGHTVYDNCKKKHVFQQLPTVAILNEIKCILVAGSYIDIDILFSEMKQVQLDTERLLIDPFAMVITEQHKTQELNATLKECIGSTGSGTGAAVNDRVSRNKEVIFAKDHPDLKRFICDTKPYIYDLLKKNKRIVIEGTQGFGLSLLHSKEYPFVTDRDTTAAGFISECGISPLDVDEIILVIRSHPIRVSGNSGYLKNEIFWNDLVRESDLPFGFVEHTTVTQKVRRVAKFDPEIVKQSIISNRPTKIVLNHMDYIPNRFREEFIRNVEYQLEQKIDFVGLDPLSVKSLGNNKKIKLHAV